MRHKGRENSAAVGASSFSPSSSVLDKTWAANLGSEEADTSGGSFSFMHTLPRQGAQMAFSNVRVSLEESGEKPQVITRHSAL